MPWMRVYMDDELHGKFESLDVRASVLLEEAIRAKSGNLQVLDLTNEESVSSTARAD